MTTRRSVRAAAVVVLMTAAALQIRAQAPPAPPAALKATVDQLGWIAGAWRGSLGDRTIEQHWMEPDGGAMVAMYRSVRGDRAMLYELLAMEQRGDEVFLRIKHFAPGHGLVSQEAKDESANHTLVSLEPRRAVFEGMAAGAPVRVTFKSPDAETLTITVERQRDGKPTSTDFNYKRVRG